MCLKSEGREQNSDMEGTTVELKLYKLDTIDNIAIDSSGTGQRIDSFLTMQKIFIVCYSCSVKYDG